MFHHVDLVMLDLVMLDLVVARLWHPHATGKLANVRTMVELVAARCPDRRIDAVYVGDRLCRLAGRLSPGCLPVEGEWVDLDRKR